MARAGFSDPKIQYLEADHFDWKCRKCDVVAWSASQLEFQFMTNAQAVYTDIDGMHWVKCSKCFKPWHLKCATEQPYNVVQATGFICC